MKTTEALRILENSKKMFVSLLLLLATTASNQEPDLQDSDLFPQI